MNTDDSMPLAAPAGEPTAVSFPPAPPTQPPHDADVLVIGAGLAGLRCAGLLAEAGVRTVVLEAGDGVGGRVRTDEVDGFLLDRGFQVLPTAYPEARAALDFDRLVLQPFYPGALVWADGRFHLAADPTRRLFDAIRHARAPIGSLADKVRLMRLTGAINAPDDDERWTWPDIPTADALAQAGISDGMIDRFFRPFLGGVFADLDLQTSARMFAFVWRMFAAGTTTVPEHGMGAIALQLAGRLPHGTVVLDAPVQAIAALDPTDGRAALAHATLRSGDILSARAIVVATDELAAARLLESATPPRRGRGLTCLYFDAPEPPIAAPVLALDGMGEGPVTNLAVMSAVSSAYAPPGRALVSATVIGLPQDDDAALEASVRAQLRGWFGTVVGDWRHLRTYRIAEALPDQSPGRLVPPVRPHILGAGLFVAGDHRTNASIDGALLSGRMAAEAVIAHL